MSLVEKRIEINDSWLSALSQIDSFFIVEVSSLIGKAKIKTIKVTGVLILGFILTWFPYQVNCLW